MRLKPTTYGINKKGMMAFWLKKEVGSVTICLSFCSPLRWRLKVEYPAPFAVFVQLGPVVILSLSGGRL